MNEFFQMLKKDHKVVAGILEELVKTENKSKNREELFKKLKVELVPHMKAEEIAYYPPLLEKKASRDVGLEGVEEHHVSEMVLKELDKMPKDQDEWGAKMKVFKELVDHHVEEEEGPIFKATEEALTPTKIQSIMKQFEEEKQKIKGTLKKPVAKRVKQPVPLT